MDDVDGVKIFQGAGKLPGPISEIAKRDCDDWSLVEDVVQNAVAIFHYQETPTVTETSKLQPV